MPVLPSVRWLDLRHQPLPCLQQRLCLRHRQNDRAKGFFHLLVEGQRNLFGATAREAPASGLELFKLACAKANGVASVAATMDVARIIFRSVFIFYFLC
jgi:hypothetical protein